MKNVAPNGAPEFQIVCDNCGGLGIALDTGTTAASDTEIKCRHCGSSRGTLEALRLLSLYGQHDQFEL
jgi:hypothetical protein